MPTTTTAPGADAGTGGHVRPNECAPTGMDRTGRGGSLRHQAPERAYGQAQYTAPPEWVAIDRMRAAMAASGIGDPGRIIADGAIHRYRGDGDRAGARNAWYVMHLDGVPAGAYGSWRTGATHTWASADRPMDPARQADIRRLVDQARQAREADTRERHTQAAECAAAMIRYSEPAGADHPYLVGHGIGPHGARQQGIALLVPIYVAGAMSSVQTILPGGRKRYLSGSRIAGGYHLVDDTITRPEILIAEGWATGAALHEHIGAAVYCAMAAGNLLAAARYVRAIHPTADIIIAADDDQWTPGNPGIADARAAAIAIGARLLVPDWTGMDLSGRPTDWCDWYGLRAAMVRGQGASA